MITPGRGHSVARSFGFAGHYLIELQAFPEIASVSHLTISVDATGQGGPPGSVLVEINHNHHTVVPDDNGYRAERYWLDPKRQYVLLRSEISNCPAIDRDPDRVHKETAYEFEDFRQSPQGIWYPALVRWKHMCYSTDKNGVRRYHDSETRFYLDFSVELPDELFTPVVRASWP